MRDNERACVIMGREEKMKKIRVFGSLNIDIVYSLEHIVRPGETLLSSNIEKNAGGKGLNQACAIAKTGLDVYMAGCVGEDGDMLLETLSSFGVDVSNVKRVKTPTGNAIIQRSGDGQNSIILFAGANRVIEKSMVDSVLSSFSQGDIIVLQNEINGLDEIIRGAKDKGMYVVFNPAPFDSSVFTLPLEKVDLLVVNEIEGAGVAGKSEDASYIEILDAILEKYPKNEVIMTCGKNGSYWQKGKNRIFEKALTVDAVDTTAAGDTYIGYFIASRELGYDTKKAMEYATLASSVTVTRKGAAGSVPEGREVFSC